VGRGGRDGIGWSSISVCASIQKGRMKGRRKRREGGKKEGKRGTGERQK
jgi:hypothetical protein